MYHLRGRDFIPDTETPSRTWLQKYIHPDDQPRVMAAIDKAVQTKSIFELEHRVLRVDGTLGWTFSRAISLQDANGEIVEWFGAASDVTERKRAEEKTRLLNVELEQRVRDRTAQLEASNKELEAFAYSVSHDLRAPVRHLSAFSESLRKRSYGKLDERARHYLDNIHTSSQHMGALIDDLLKFSRLGRAGMSKADVALEPLVQEVRRELEPETAGRTILWNVSSLPEIYADPALLQQVFVNLISNAVKYTRGRQQTQIEIGCTDGTSGEHVIFIRDNGVGFEMTYVDKLFKVFQRLHTEFEGTGIGLANVRRIVERHGGRVWAEGVPEQGATFYFSIPTREGG
jgi:light-regulated signal transduction histidine kinase (bacteriophytochrome)